MKKILCTIAFLSLTTTSFAADVQWNTKTAESAPATGDSLMLWDTSDNETNTVTIANVLSLVDLLPVKFNSYSVDQTLTAAAHNQSLVQFTAAAEATLWDCETANVGQYVMLWARDAEKIEVVPASGDAIALFNGTALTAGNELDIAATAGTKVTLMCTADDTWSVINETAASTDGGAAD